MRARQCFRCTWELTGYEPVFCGACGAAIPALFSAHPGAGVSALATSTGFRDAPAAVSDRTPQLLVGRTHVSGLAFIRTALDAGRAGFVRVILVPDAPGKLPKPLRDQVAVLSAVTPVTMAPWVESWRHAPGIETNKAVFAFRTILNAALVEQLHNDL